METEDGLFHGLAGPPDPVATYVLHNKFSGEYIYVCRQKAVGYDQLNLQHEAVTGKITKKELKALGDS